jgi:hypothetical protein
MFVAINNLPLGIESLGIYIVMSEAQEDILELCLIRRVVVLK